MANFFDQFETEQKSEPAGNFFDQFDAGKKEAAAGNFFDKFDAPKQKAEPTESGGFFGSLGSALKERFATAVPAAKLYTGLGDQAQATEEMLAAKKESDEAFRQTEFSDIGKMFKEGHYGDALGMSLDKFKEVAGSSLGAMAPAMVAGAGAAAAAPVALPAAAVGTAAFAVVSLGSYIADNIGRQKEELKKEGKEYQDINRMSATVAGAGQTALDVIGFKFFKPLGALVGIEGKAAAEKTAMEIVEAATKPGAYKRAVAKGLAEGVAFEVPQEVAQQVLERWQAGLPLNPFDDPEAAREYGEAAGGALLLGGPMGAGSKVMQTRASRQSPEGQALLKEATEGSVYDALSKGAEDVTRPEPATTGVRTEMAGQPDTVPAPGGVGEPDTSRLVSPRQPVSEIDEGAGAEPGALAPTEVDKWAARAESALGTAAVSSKYGEIEGESTGPRPPALTENARQNYNDLRSELIELMSITHPTVADSNRMKLVQRDLAQLVSENASAITTATGNPEFAEFRVHKDKKLPALLLNPFYDGDKVFADIELANEPAEGRSPVGAAPTQRELIPPSQTVNRLLNFAMAASGRDKQAAIEYLQQYKQRQQERYDNGEFDANWAAKMAAMYGLTRGEAARNPDAVAQMYLSDINARVDQSIGDLEQRTRRPVGAPAPQGDMFGAGEAPDTGVEHVRNTEEAKDIKEFFDAVRPATESPAEIAKHEALRNNAVDALVEYDITKPGETTSMPLALVREMLAARFGGLDKFRAFVGQLAAMSPAQQSAAFTRMGLPDLTTRRGLEQFYNNAQVELEQMTAPEGGVKVPTRSMPAVSLPETRAELPHVEDFQTMVGQLREYKGTTHEGRLPRKAEVVHKRVEHALSDTKIRRAMRVLRDKIELRRDVTKEDLAAKTYFDNPQRTTASQAINALAFDLAMYEIDPKSYGANSSFMGEGGEYANRFRDWVEKNLDKSTVRLLDELIDEHRQTARALEKYDAFVTKWNEQKETLAEERRKLAEKESGANIPRAPRVKKKKPFVAPVKVIEAVGETEATEAEEVETPAEIPPQNIPRLQAIYSVHPDIQSAIERGDTNAALKAMADAKGNPYYSALAQRLLDAKVTASISFIENGELEPLNNYNPEILPTFNRMLGTLRTIAAIAANKNQIVADLKSNNRDRIFQGIEALYKDPELSDSERQQVTDTAKFAVENFGWDGKYDPNTDNIVFRRDAPITNATFLHEVLHAATYNLIDDSSKLKGVQLQGYEQLKELYKYASGTLQNTNLTPMTVYGLKDLHEFVSEALTNPDFQATLRNLRYKASPHSLYSRFMHAVRLLFRIDDNSAESNVLNEVIKATDAMMATPSMKKTKPNTGYFKLREPSKETPPVDSQMKLPLGASPKSFPLGRANSKTAIRNLMTSRSWNELKGNWPRFYASLKADLRPAALGALTMRQMADLVGGRIPQLNNFIREAEAFLARKNEILTESGHISKRWEKLQAHDPETSRKLAAVMHRATISEVDPDPTSNLSTANQRNKEPVLMDMWRELSKNPEAVAIYREARDFYEKRYSEYRQILNQRLISMRKFGVSEKTISDIRAEFDKARRKGPYFPLMRHGRFWYQVGTGSTREYYMFESQGEMEAHLEQNPRKDELTAHGSEYKQQQDLYARQSQFLKSTFDAIDASNMSDKQDLKDAVYQAWLTTQPESSFRNQFIHRQKVAGYSEDALRNFAKSSFHMAYQLSRFEHSQDMFSQIAAARLQLKERNDAADPANVKTMRENAELNDYVGEMSNRLSSMLNPTDVGTIPSILSNIGFIWYLTAPASAIVNVVGGMMIGLPTLVGQQVRLNPNMSYMKATLKSLNEMKTVAAQIMRTGFDLETGTRAKDYMLHFPSLTRSNELNATDKKAYDLFVADGLIDITATYDQSGLAAAPTESYTGTRHRVMQALAGLFHNAERFNREIMAMSAFRTGMEKRKGYADQQKAFDESIAEAKDVTNRSMFDYSSMNKPRYFQHPVARVVLQFKQFPQQMTFFLVHNFLNMIKGATPEVKREATARFVGTMGMAGIFSGVTGLWGFSTVASIVNAVINGLDDDRDEPFDFELEFVNWANETFGGGLGMFVARGAGNAVGVDLASRTQLDGMWFRDGRKNQDEVEALQSFLVDQLGPTVGLGINAAQAIKLWNEGHADRAIEMVSPAFVKNPMIAARYAREGANTLAGDPLVSEIGPFDLMMQSLGLRPAEIAERQYYNITKKGQEQAIMKERQNLLNLYGISFMANDFDANEKAMDKIMKFNGKHPSVAIPADSIVRSIKERATKSAMTDHGLYIDKRMLGLLDESYLNSD